MEEEPGLTPEEISQLQELGVGATPVPEERQNVHAFLHNVATAEDTTKIGNLDKDELGTPKLPQRTLKELALFCEDVANQKYFADYFRKRAEILTSTSLSKDAKLIDLAVVRRTEVANKISAPAKENKGWFKPKNKNPQHVSQY